jgi:hypothetical protein
MPDPSAERAAARLRPCAASTQPSSGCYDPLRLRSYVATLDLAAGAIEAEPRETG